MFVLLQKVCTHEQVGTFARNKSLYVCASVERMSRFNTGHFLNKPLCVILLLLLRVCTNVGPRISEKSVVYMFGLLHRVCINKIFCIFAIVLFCLYLWLCWYSGYVHMQYWEFQKLTLLTIFVMLQRVCINVRTGILARNTSLYVYVVVEGNYA